MNVYKAIGHIQALLHFALTFHTTSLSCSEVIDIQGIMEGANSQTAHTASLCSVNRGQQHISTNCIV